MSKTVTVADKAIDCLGRTDDWIRASEVAEDIDSSTNYTREVLNELHESGEVKKKEDGAIIGTTIHDNLWVLDSRDQAKNVIRLYGDLTEEEMGSMTLDELRTHVKQELGDWTGPIQNKVWYKRD